MKKLTIIFMIMIMFLTSCDNSKNNEPNLPPDEGPDDEIIESTELSIEDYFPFIENTKYEYTGEGNEYATYTVFTDYIKGDRIQTRSNNGGTEIVRVLENKSGQLKVLLDRAETYFREDFTNVKNNNGEILLKEPIKVGTSWNNDENTKISITNIDVDTTIPLGTFKALEVTTEGKDYTIIDYYAKDIGLIKTVNAGNGYEVSSTLSKIENDVPLIQNINLYYPNMEESVLNSAKIDISFKTNDDVKDIIENAIKNISTQNEVLTSNVKINKLYLGDDGIVHIDFSKELISEMNAGAYYESMILQSITNTLGMYYGIEKIYITVDSKPYESGHIQKNEGEPFTIDFENVKPVE
ncbi:hypothetical protein J2Z76_002482 [Sedimentibacter acidaminivorans]|uniref:GerMN domain-containing protein n=1 Tax=Sedimentibacter acidaminivorans TaxID=913099 RepID=A0ABS4GG00_9FIRM|nr:GerMN domain-containing protein [Sedimentibacter acidaminivorans]MBP1926613.1 hypothetical protein [Sedimentibacter acidaminivorans]